MGRIPIMTGLRITLLAALALSPPITAQTPPARVDSSRSDTLYRAHGALAAVFYSLPFAPALAVFAFDTTDTTTFAGGPLPWNDFRLSAYSTTGIGTSDTITNATYSANLELSVHGTYTSVRLERFANPVGIQYLTVRAGLTAHRAHNYVGGMTLGYRDGRGVGSHSGLEVAFPLIVGGPRRRVRFETSHLIRRGVFWNYRVQADWRLRGGPLFIGAEVDGHDMAVRRGGRIGPGSAAIMLGVRR
jgi:hypothetical protein